MPKIQGWASNEKGSVEIEKIECVRFRCMLLIRPTSFTRLLDLGHQVNFFRSLIFLLKDYCLQQQATFMALTHTYKVSQAPRIGSYSFVLCGTLSLVFRVFSSTRYCNSLVQPHIRPLKRPYALSYIYIYIFCFVSTPPHFSSLHTLFFLTFSTFLSLCSLPLSEAVLLLLLSTRNHLIYTSIRYSTF